MKLYMALAHPWAQVLPQPPPVLPGLRACQIGAVEQHTVKASGS